MLDKWKHAVIHLECATDSEHFYDRIKRMDEQRSLLDQGKISLEEFLEETAGRSRDVRCHGTALFLHHAGRRYLLTARHVVWDERSAKRELEEEAQRAQSRPTESRTGLADSATNRAQSNIFNMIFRVPSLDEMVANKDDPAFLMSLGAGSSSTVPYTFSEPDLDLAVISLDQRNSKFADELQSLGFEPISSDAISEGPEAEGQEVFTIGYPSSTAFIGQVSQDKASANWSSSYFSLPVSTFGRVSMLHDMLSFFWADMSIYPGNSGGPLIADDRLVGIVSAQATLPIDEVPDVTIRIPFGKFIKAKFVSELLVEQEQKDKWRIGGA